MSRDHRDLLLENPLWIHDRKAQRWLPPTAEDIRRWLMANPSEAVEIVRGLKVAGPWEDVGFSIHTRSCGDGTRAARIEWMGNGIGYRATARMCGGSDYADLAAAKSAADAALREAGWSLADE